jgi:hypothetical protein
MEDEMGWACGTYRGNRNAYGGKSVIRVNIKLVIPSSQGDNLYCFGNEHAFVTAGP